MESNKAVERAPDRHSAILHKKSPDFDLITERILEELPQ